MEGCLEISFVAMMDTFIADFSSWGYVISYIFSVLLLLILVVSIFWMRYWLRKKDHNDQKLIQKYGSLYEGFKPSKESVIMQEWFVLRRVIFAAAAFYAMG